MSFISSCQGDILCASAWPREEIKFCKTNKMRMEEQIAGKGKGMVSGQIYYFMPKE